MSDCAPSTLEVIQPWVTWALVIVGWGFVHYTSALRERRKEDAAFVDNLVKSIEAIRDLAEAYYTIERSAEENVEQAALLKLKLRSLGSRLHVLRKRDRYAYDLQSELIAFRKAITLSDIGAARKLRTRADAVVQRIWSAADVFSNAAYVAVDSAHPIWPWWR